jgi:hypothetical protein
MDPVQRVVDGLASGEIGEADLTARRLGALLGKTTSVLYHHFGSLDLFLFAVSQAGFARLGAALAPARSLDEAAASYLDFAVARPVLYRLMFERAWNWAELKKHRDLRTSTGFQLWTGLVQRLRLAGSSAPEADARVFYAGLHGLASLAISGRANVDDLTRTDRESAGHAARRLVALITTSRP